MIPEWTDGTAFLEWLRGREEVTDYRIDRELGASASARTFLANDQGSAAPVVIKIFPKSLSNQGWQDSAQEARFQMQLTHLNKARILRYSKVGPWPFLVTEYIEGLSLVDWVLQDPERRAGQKQFRELLTHFASLSEALLYCHRSGLIHGAIKPSNIIVEKGSERPVFVDFLLFKGPSELSEGAENTGFFPSPEQRNPDLCGPITAKTDVWALAASLFIVAQHSPMSPASWSNDPPETIRKNLTLNLRYEDSEAPSWLIKVLDSALQNQPSQRIGMEEFGAVIFERSLGTPPNKIVLALLTLAILIFMAYYLRG